MLFLFYYIICLFVLYSPVKKRTDPLKEINSDVVFVLFLASFFVVRGLFFSSPEHEVLSELL